jgi:phage-related protein (TIGR01555 family)
MSDRPRVRVPVPTTDTFQNHAARLGWGTDNLAARASYGLNLLSRNRALLENMYRGSWVVGQVVDVVAEDMTRAGVAITGEMKPDQMEQLQAAMRRLAIWQRLADTIRWSRLYGGALAVLMVDGQDTATPLRQEAIRRGQFRGLLVLDRWQVQPSVGDLITELGPDFGMPRFYDVVTGERMAGRSARIHHSRVVRIDGLALPYWQSWTENGWGMSVIERLFDRLLAFDSASAGAAQLVYKAHLRTVHIEGLRELIAMGGKAYDAVIEQMKMIRLGQSNEGLTVLDTKDQFAAHSYSFSGLSDVLLQFGQQLSGATQIPLVRLFGQSPAGLNSSGESDLRTYYDGIRQQQEDRLRQPVEALVSVLCRSELGIEPPPGFGVEFAPLWQLSDKEKAEIANTTTAAVIAARSEGLISDQVALRELRQSSRVSGVWSNITDQDIEAADSEPPKPEEIEPPEPGADTVGGADAG